MRPSFAASFALTALAAIASAQNDIRSGPWQTASEVPKGWVVHNTRNYHVQSQAGIEKAKRLGDHMEVMNIVYRKLFKPDKSGAKQQTIKLFKDQQSYLAYGAQFGVGPGAAAYYAPDLREMVCYDTGKWMDEKAVAAPITGPEGRNDRAGRSLGRSRLNPDLWKMDLLGCAAHEGWHQYYHWLVVSRVGLPSWINEGMGDYFYTAAPKDEPEGKKKREATLGNVNDGRLMVLKMAKRQDRMVPLREFLQYLQQQYYSNPSICYAQGWAFCQFLLHGADGKYAKVIPTYIKLLCNDTNWEQVQTKAFKGIDIEAMEKEFHAFVDGLKLSVEEEEEPETESPPPSPPAPPADPAGQPPGTGQPPGGG